MSDKFITIEEIRKDVEAGEPLRRARARILLREIDRIESENDKLRDDLADLQCWYDALRAGALSLTKYNG